MSTMRFDAGKIPTTMLDGQPHDAFRIEQLLAALAERRRVPEMPEMLSPKVSDYHRTKVAQPDVWLA
jgi:cytochrome c556